MKKKYVKPFVLIESFQLDAAIAGSCSSGTPINHYEDSCGFGAPSEPGFNFEYFAGDACVFDVTLDGDDDNSTNCYHGPYLNDSGQIFVWS